MFSYTLNMSWLRIDTKRISFKREARVVYPNTVITAHYTLDAIAIIEILSKGA
jgi:hypothetical protein